MCCRLLRVTLDGSSASNACKLNPSIHLGRQGSNWLPLYWSSFPSVTLDSSLITIWKTVDVCQVRFLIWFGFWSPSRGFLSIVFVICLLGVRWCCVLAMHCRGRHGAFASREGEWDRMAEKMMLEFGESGHPVFRATSPLSRGQFKSKSGGNLSIHYCADLDTIKTVLPTLISVNQLSLYGAVAEICEEYETFYDRTGQPVVGRIEFLIRAKRDQDRSAFGL